MAVMRFGVHLAAVTSLDASAPGFFGRITEVAQAAESAGFDAVFVPDHVHQNAIGGGPTGPMFEAYTLLGGLAACTSTARLGTLVTAVTLRNPALLAKSVTSVDVISGGRAILGVGAAWDEAEHHSYGIPFPSLGERIDRLEHTVRICRAMFTELPASHAAGAWTIDDAYNAPSPVNGDIPILVGGGGERRTLRLVAELADVCNLIVRDHHDLETIRHKLDVLERHCHDVGRDPADITKTANVIMPPDDVDELVSVIGAFLGVGLDGAVVFAAAPDADGVHAWGTALTKRFGPWMGEAP